MRSYDVVYSLCLVYSLLTNQDSLTVHPVIGKIL